MYIVALTGGIGSGKSTTSNIFMQLGITVIDADIISRQVVKPNTYALHVITDHFGTSIINTDGTLNRRLLRELIFFYPDEKNWLNAFLHPIIHYETQRQIAKATSPYVIWVVPLLVENQLHKKADRVLVVDVVPEVQIQRIMKRDNISHEYTKRILLAQTTREARLAVADNIIDNNGTYATTAAYVYYLHTQYLIYATQIIS